MAEAVFTFTPVSARKQVSLHLGLQAEGYGFPEILRNLTVYGWHFLRERLSRGDLMAEGIVDGDTEPRPMHPSLFDRADLDPATGEMLAAARRYRGVRIFESQSAAAKAGEKDQYRSGGPGRPSSVYLAQAEMRRRHKAGQMLGTLAAECRALVEWRKEVHPNSPPLTAKSLSESIRAEYRELCQKP